MAGETGHSKKDEDWQQNNSDTYFFLLFLVTQRGVQKESHFTQTMTL